MKNNQLITIELFFKGLDKPLTALVNSGATGNFLCTRSLISTFYKVNKLNSLKNNNKNIGKPIRLRLTNGKVKATQSLATRLNYKCNQIWLHDTFRIIDMHLQYDAIVGMPWLMKHQPSIN